MWVPHAPGMPGTFSPPPRFSYISPTCITTRASRMPGSLTCDFLWSQWRGKHSRHSRRMRNPQFNVSGKRPMPWPVTKLQPRMTEICIAWLFHWSFQAQLMSSCTLSLEHWKSLEISSLILNNVAWPKNVIRNRRKRVTRCCRHCASNWIWHYWVQGYLQPYVFTWATIQVLINSSTVLSASVYL